MERKPLQRLEAGLPAAWYHDPAHYQQELEAFWYRRWVVVAREAELAATGDWRTVRVGTQSMVLVRDEDQIRAFHNTCRHRGSVLCTEEQGSFARKRIVCPYHSWTYDLAGQLVATPRRMETPDFRLADFRLYPAAVASWGGFIFINLAGRDAPPPTDESLSVIDELTGESNLIASDDLGGDLSDADGDPGALGEKQESGPATRRRAKPKRRRG